MYRYHWFSNYPGYDWNPTKGYNALFAEQVRLIREWFSLQKTKRPGVEETTGKWRLYDLQGQTVFISVDKFEWRDYTRRAGGITPVFKLRLRIAREKPKGFVAWVLNDDSRRGMEVFLQQTMHIEFPSDYPDQPPRFRIDNRRYDVESASHSHHMFEGGWFCILAGSGDWSRSRDTIISGLNAALDWVVWHFNKFGW
ncbi:hypothetical protein A2962_02850 [Candidatus Woesebacteria bacterium RIFCSPLOWO2_01_FULL_39_61]|uniref:Uncharacterized protein n=1 Tax=Candidatus Woesebacteria bacterium RIFCSPHIGHO2_02_FULL_39_13 TaxID=1802505 RepID=A0A1F7Z008_9BACT|nr:MAG: hypothetical protein A2692_00035 [Candidatus Woesebacteria bacterium RIFCSPHIGHO2_01_FULL_39_95]OGM32419.1 MAG: hypothetical protein A3D01_04565 [Candidatus Woesebacteria bacterium RIFCSPHIGHO2_02_FULL_39_13]OGM38127.1 MAG: hypothetical protein A3E13_02595 [Candidatus Woesebacteria bacterium RIFCSPHIGHO2_12_FULL_40_20]OGM67378.1 MAG: hypothetical protein A2962_02850 [Candidatus Woesebacteria bacterium RIFCSPLOWO2_01_FULL_39_61]OGM75465.1 MAG: hypothetical protein A3H19_03015 [Candidatus